MLTPALVLALVATGQVAAPEAAHAANPVYKALLDEGLTLDGVHLEFPAPALRDGLSAAGQRAALVKVAGSPARLDDVLRKSVTAPFVLKLHDDTAKNGNLVRTGTLYFAVHAELDEIDPDDLTRRGSDEKPVEAGNMRFVSHVLNGGEELDRGLVEAKQADARMREWFVHVDGRLLDRIAVAATDHVTATHTSESWVVASRTDPRFDDDKRFPNRWRPVGGKAEGASTAQRYAGGGSCVKISKLAAPAGALFVEAHFAFDEPRAWFDGAPILRSKLSLVAQDQIRRLRRELAQRKSKPKSQ